MTELQPGATELNTPVLRVRALGKNVDGPEGRLEILEGVDLTVNAGESLAILGPSGSGKSTLLSLLAGLDTATSGTVDLLGAPLHQRDEDARARLRAGRVGFVFQNFQLLPGLSALENVMLPLELLQRSDARPAALDMLDRVGLADRASHLPAQLSGGEQQRVAIARAFVSSPGLVFADEPTGNLDHATGERIMDLMFDAQGEHGAALVLVTHDAALAERCDRRMHMRAGQLWAEDAVA